MSKKNNVKLFQNTKIRTVWDESKEEWFFSVNDVLGVLVESKNPQSYWSTLKQRLIGEGVEPITICDMLKMPAKDGKMRLTDVADTKQMLRIIQSVSSPKAEPFKQWLAKIGQERLDEIADPEKAIDRALDTYRAKGYNEEWINQRMKSKGVRKNLTDEWDRSGVKKGKEYGILTNEITDACFGMTTKEYKNFKKLKKENLRDNMTDLELILTMLGEASTTEISKTVNPKGFKESKRVAYDGGSIAGNARKELEERTGKKVISNKNAKNPKLLSEK